MKLILELERRAGMEESVDLELDTAVNLILVSKLNITHRGEKGRSQCKKKPITESLPLQSLKEPE